MEIITTCEIEKLLFDILNTVVEVNEKNYFKITRGKIVQISYTSKRLGEEKINSSIHSIGVPIIMIENKKEILLPGILHIINNIPAIKVSKKKAVIISYNKKVKLLTKDGLFIILDQKDRKISLGWVKGKIYYSILDLGWYLRSER